MTKVLRPIIDRPQYHAIVEDDIKRFLLYALYKPIMDIIKDPYDERANASAYFLTAIKTGRIAFVDGFFVGEFNSRIGLEMRRLGAKFNHTRKAYAIKLIDLPMDVRTAINTGQKRIQDVVKKIYGKLDELKQESRIKSIDFETTFAGVFIDLDKQLSTTITGDLSIPMDQTPYLREELKKNYTENLNLEIKQWYDTAIIRLRNKVYKNVEEGYRAAHLIPLIQSEKQVSYNKAKFLAKQETSLLVSKYREARYTRLGLRQYKWMTAGDARVRPDATARREGHTENNHRKLNGRIFSWDEPPVVDSATGRRCNPGEDFNCRCVAVPVIE